MERFYSFIVPVYNRPEELEELLESLYYQTFRSFEVIVVEDGSDLRSEKLVSRFNDRLSIEYLDLMHSGPSLARNVGSQAAGGTHFIYVDSDCLLPSDYLEHVDRYLEKNPVEFFGGPDRASSDFNRIQQAVSYAMTSFLTTGGVRGGKKKVDKFYPRSFNMGISREAFFKVGGYPQTKMHPGEDMVLSIELISGGFSSGFIPEAYVYHKRRTSLRKFLKQVFGFGKTRLILSKVYPDTFSVFFLAPSLFLAGSLLMLVLTPFFGPLALSPLAAWAGLLFLDATIRTRSLITGVIALLASFVQLYGYGAGFLSSAWNVYVRRKDVYGVLKKGFYPGRRK